MFPSNFTTSVLTLLLAAACAAPSAQHSAAATSHGSAAAAMSGATVSAVPLVVGGASMAVTGAALESAGTASVQGGSDVLDTTLGAQPMCDYRDVHGVCITPNAPPVL